MSIETQDSLTEHSARHESVVRSAGIVSITLLASRLTGLLREIIMARCLRHDRYDVIGDAPGLGGGRTYAISLSRPGRTATTNVDVVPATDHRWYVQKVDMDKLTDYCR